MNQCDHVKKDSRSRRERQQHKLQKNKIVKSRWWKTYWSQNFFINGRLRKKVYSQKSCHVLVDVKAVTFSHNCQKWFNALSYEISSSTADWNLKNLKKFKKYVVIPNFLLQSPENKDFRFLNCLCFFQAAFLFLLSVSFCFFQNLKWGQHQIQLVRSMECGEPPWLHGRKRAGKG